MYDIAGTIQNGKTIADFEDMSKWSLSPAPTAPGGAISANTAEFHSGTQSLKISCSGTGYVYATCFLDQPLDLSMLDVFSIWLSWKRKSTSSAISLYLSSDQTPGTFHNYVQFTAMPASEISGLRGDSGPIAFTWKKSNSGSVGSINWAKIRNILVRLYSASVNGEEISIDTFVCGAITRPVVIITTDDSIQTQDFDMMSRYSEAHERGINLTHYTQMEAIGTTGRLTMQNLYDLQNAGDLIAAHTVSSLRYVSGNATYSQALEDMRAMRAWLKQHGFHGHEYYAWYGGQYFNGELSYIGAAYEAGFKIARSIMGSGVARGNVGVELTNIGVIEPMVFNSRHMLTGLTSLKADVDRVIKEGGVACSYVHTISTGSATPNNYEITGADWVSFLDYVKGYRDAGILDVMTMQEYYNSLKTGGSIQIVFEVEP